MQDILGRNINKKDIIVYANDEGWLTFALVTGVEENNRLQVVKRGYRNKPFEKVLVRPADTMLVDKSVLASFAFTSSRTEDINFLMNYTETDAGVTQR